MPKPKQSQKKDEMSKMAIDEKELKSETIPNVVTTGGMEEIGIKRISPIEIPQYLLMHPALPRGIEIKANRMIKLVEEDLESNIIINKKKHKLAEEALEYCKDILYNSGGPLYLKQMAQGAYRFGTSFSVLQTNLKETEVLRLEYQHEIFFGPAKYPRPLKGKGIDWGNMPMEERAKLAGKMKINPKTKKIAKYTQLTKQYPEAKEENFLTQTGTYINTRTHPSLKQRSPGELAPSGKEFDESEVVQLAFDTIGDEPLGISLVQFLHLTIKYILNMERGAAQTQVNFGFNRWVANTPFKDVNKMKIFGQTIANINKDAVVVLPEGIELKNIEPGTTDFEKVHPIFMQLIAIRLGIPIPLLTQAGMSTNKSELAEMRKDMYDDFIADELTIERMINEAFFKSCQVKYPELTIKELNLVVPKFKFNQPPEDLDAEMDRNLKFSLMIRNYTTAMDYTARTQDMGGIELKDTIQNIAYKVDALIKKSMALDELETIETQKHLKEIPTGEEKKESDKDEEKKEVEKDDD